MKIKFLIRRYEGKQKLGIKIIESEINIKKFK